MAPDFEYFVHLRPLRTIGHDLAGVALLDVPAGLLALIVFERVMKGPLIDLLPDRLGMRLVRWRDPMPFLPVGRLGLITASLAIGALSHIAWDAFTHEDGAFVLMFPSLSATAVALGGRDVKVFKVLQHGSTAIGLALLVWWGARWVERQPIEPAADPFSAGRRLALLAGIGVFSLTSGLLLAASQPPGGGPAGFVGRFVVSAGSMLLLAILVYSVGHGRVRGDE
jgi:hypothetical protein